MNQKKKTIVLWGVIIVLAAAVVALSVILVTKSRKNNDPDGQKNAGTEAVIEGSGQDAEQKAEDGADQKKEKGASDTQKSTDDKKTLFAEVTVGSTWENNGMTAATETVTIYNKTDKAATDWSVDLEFSGKVTIDQLWNGKYTADGSVVHVTAESYNEEIPAGGSIDFGYNLSASDVKPVRCTLMIAGKEVTTVTGEKAAQTDGQSVDSDKKDQSGSNKVTDTKNGKKEDNPYKAHGKLAVSGTDLVDASGSKFQLKGVSTHGLTWFADFVSKDTYQYFKDSFGINAETIIPIIRKNAPDAIIIVGTPTWSQDVDVAAADPITDQTNLMYAVHFYAATHKDDLRNKVQSALDSGLPIFVSEFGLCDASGNGSIDYNQSDAWFDLINDRNLSYAAWNISNKAETSSLFDSSCTKTSGFTDDDLSDSGRYIKEKIESFY